jgi:AraC-like DNA-binding protein
MVDNHMIHGSIPVTRVAFLLRYARFIEHLGAPLGHLLAASGIDEELLDHPAAVVSLDCAYRFGELACKATGTEHLGLHIGMQTSLENLGPVGEDLKRSTTVYDYLRRGIALYDMLITGQRIWLSDHDEEICLNVATVAEPGIGPYQSQLETLAATVMALRRALGRNWSPREIGLTYKSREDFPENSCFTGSHIVERAETSYMVIPRAALAKRFSGANFQAEQVPESIDTHRLSGDLSDLVQLQIEALLCERRLHIDTVAESLQMSRRSLQRSLFEKGTSYSKILSDTRILKAMDRLAFSDEPVADIAFTLGYSDASNFTRAFRHRNGVSPQKFRQNLNPGQSSMPVR